MNEEVIEEVTAVEGEGVIDVVVDAGQEAVESVTETCGVVMTWVKSNMFHIITTAVIVLAIYIIYKAIVRWIKKIPSDKLPVQRSMILTKMVKYVAWFLMIMYILNFFGIKLSAIWGAAGVAGVALAFAAQTSVSNIISGIFIMVEKTMKPGDLITVDGETGIVDIVGLLSVQIHTLDNQLIRIPNSTIINSNFKNTSFFEKRRMTINVDVSYDTDMEFALKTIQKVPAFCKTVLKDPAPSAWFDGFGESGITLVLAVWFNSADFLKTKNDVFIAIKKVFDEAKIEIPYNKIDVNFPDAKTTAKKVKKNDGKRSRR